MNIYRITQTERDGYDTYSDCVVIAPDENAARDMHPGASDWYASQDHDFDFDVWHSSSWACSPCNVNVELVGTAKEGETQRFVCASFHAG
jgi:hypothetical protein